MMAGKMRQRIDIQEPAESRGATGEVLKAWRSVAQRWAEVRPLNARERVAHQQAGSVATHLVRMRYYDGLTSRHRLLFGTRTFQIDGTPRNMDERDEMTELTAREIEP